MPQVHRILSALLVASLVLWLGQRLWHQSDATIPLPHETTAAAERPLSLSPEAERDRRAAIALSQDWIVLSDENPEDRGPVEALFVDTRDENLRRSAVEAMVHHDAKDWPADHRRQFLAGLAPAALQSALEHQIPVSVTLAQAVLESGWGRSALAQDHNNLFGVKAGQNSRAVTMSTTEAIGGQTRVQRERFRTYDNWEESLAHHDALLAHDPRYVAATDRWADWREYLSLVAPVYASDPRYTQLIASIVERYRLDRWDHLVVEVSAQN